MAKNGAHLNQYTVDPEKRLSPPKKDTVFRRLERSVPRDEMIAILAACPDERADRLRQIMLSPSGRRNKASLPNLAKKAGLTYGELLRMITIYRLDEGLLRMSEHVPKVLEDVAIDAESQIIDCPDCKGEGVKAVAAKVADDDDADDSDDDDPRVADDLVIPVPCPSCDGTGKLRKIGDETSRRLLFETIGLTNKARGPLVNINAVSSGNLPSVEDEMDRASKVLDVGAPVAQLTSGSGPGGDGDPK